MSGRKRPHGGGRPIRLTGSIATRQGDLSVSFEVSDSLRLRSVVLSGTLLSALPQGARESIARSLEGAPLDQEVLVTVLRRAFQEAQVAIEGVAPDDLARAVVGARERPRSY